jgi:ribonuclease HI
MDEIRIYTDGSSLGNPGKGGYGIILKWKHKVKKASKGFRLTTNNRMELLAVIEALKLLNDSAKEIPITIYSDSQYVINAITKKWLNSWVKKNFKDKKNADLWRKYIRVAEPFSIEFEWVKGHSGHPENEECDQLAKKAAEGDKLGIDIGYENTTKSNSNRLF